MSDEITGTLDEPQGREARPQKTSMTRRQLMLGIGGIAALAGLGCLKFTPAQALVRPPGGQDEAALIANCVRCEKCVEFAREGKTAALICSGDAGVYGMASPLLEIAEREGFTDVEVIPGVTAALSGAALLGAPLSHDFCVISLSDLMTPWELIEKRLRCAAEGDFCIAIYNPASRKRADYLQKACGILARTLPEDTPCGYVRNIGRDGCETIVCSLKELSQVNVDMFVTVFIGNSRTRAVDGKLITPRGYRI